MTLVLKSESLVLVWVLSLMIMALTYQVLAVSHTGLSAFHEGSRLVLFTFPRGEYSSYSCFNRCKSWGSGRLSSLPKVPKPNGGGAGVETSAEGFGPGLSVIACPKSIGPWKTNQPLWRSVVFKVRKFASVICKVQDPIQLSVPKDGV